MMSLTRIIVPAPVQNRSASRRSSLGPVGCFRRAVSDQLSVCDWLMSLRGSFRGIPPWWTVVARSMIHRLFPLRRLSKVGIPSSFLSFVLCLLGVVYLRVGLLLLRYLYVVVLVAELGHGPGIGSSTDGDVFVCEAALETPAQESDIASLLPDEASWHTRTQHGRAAVGLDPSVIHNEWENGMFPYLFFLLLFDLSSIWSFECVCLAVRFLSLLPLRFWYIIIFVISWSAVCPHWFSCCDVGRTVCHVGSKCCPGWADGDAERD